MEKLDSSEKINKLVINLKYQIITFNHFRNIFVLKKFKDKYFFAGLGWIDNVWSLEATEESLKEILYQCPPSLCLFTNQLEFAEWVYKITKDGK